MSQEDAFCDLLRSTGVSDVSRYLLSIDEHNLGTPFLILLLLLPRLQVIEVWDSWASPSDSLTAWLMLLGDANTGIYPALTH
jgi:hypothetical protein